ncbi:MAG: 50S ribosomal protein L16 [Spirochaetales bacterium]|jgi:large subunit ribosomal protein L16|nr:50S ribosomal protein L16 [Spirochaetales bacterium]
MLSPKRTKYRKRMRQVKKTLGGYATRNNSLEFGEYGLICMDPKWITNRQIEAASIAMTRHMKRGGKVWIRIFPDVPYTKKPAETRMGKGKGNPEYWVAAVKPGTVMFEIAGVEKKVAEEALTLAGSKLPVRTKLFGRKD